MRGTVRRAIRCRIYKERRWDLCRTVGYLSVSMVHAISLHGYRYVLSTSEAESLPPPYTVFFSSFLPLSLRVYPALLLDLSLTLFLSFFIFEARLDLPGDTCRVDPVNTTSSIVKAKRLGLPSSSGISSAKKSRKSYKNRRNARIFDGVKVFAF